MAEWKASGISDALERGLAGFSGRFVYPYYEIGPFDQGEVHFNITSEVNCASEEYVEKHRIFAAIDDDDDDDDDDNDGEFLPGAISSSDDSEEENDEEIENN